MAKGEEQSRTGRSRTIRMGALEIDGARRRVGSDGDEVELTRTEFDLLAALMSSADEVLSRSRLAEAVRPDRTPVSGHTIEVHINNLRAKLAEAGHSPDLIKTVRGVGYRLDPSLADQAPPRRSVTYVYDANLDQIGEAQTAASPPLWRPEELAYAFVLLSSTASGDLRRGALAACRSMFETGTRDIAKVVATREPDGSPGWVEVRIELLGTPDGEFAGVRGDVRGTPSSWPDS